MKKNTALEKIVQYITMHPHMHLDEGCELIVNWANSQVSDDVKKDEIDSYKRTPDVAKKIAPTATPTPTDTPTPTSTPTPTPTPVPVVEVEEPAKIGPSDDHIPAQDESEVIVEEKPVKQTQVKPSNRRTQ